MSRSTPRIGKVTILLAVAVPLFAADPAGRFITHSDNRVTMAGTTSVHDWTAEGHFIEGFLEPGVGFPTEPGQVVPPGKVEAVVEVSIPVSSLHGRSKKMDEVMYEKLNERTSRYIRYRLSELRLKAAPVSKEAPYTFDAAGMLVVAGVTNRISMPVEVLPLDAKRLKVTGRTTVKMSDFGIAFPPIETSTGSSSVPRIAIGDDVTLGFEWLVER